MIVNDKIDLFVVGILYHIVGWIARYGTTVRNTPYSRWDVISNFEHFVNEFKNRAGV